MSKNNKDITMEKLADMMETGFEHVLNRVGAVEDKMATKEQANKLEKEAGYIKIRLEAVEEDISEIRKHQIAHTIYRDEFEKLQNRVKALEKLLVAKG